MNIVDRMNQLKITDKKIKDVIAKKLATKDLGSSCRVESWEINESIAGALSVSVQYSAPGSSGQFTRSGLILFDANEFANCFEE